MFLYVPNQQIQENNMSALTLFIAEIVSSAVIAVAVSRHLRPTLSDSLELLCGSPQAKQFWLTFTHLMLLIVPLLCVLLFSQPRDIAADQVADALRSGLLQILLGIFAALLSVGWNVWRFADQAKRLDVRGAGNPAIAPIREA